MNTKTAVPTPSSETVQTGGDISGAAAISAAVHADTPPSATSAPTGERPYLGVIVQTVSCAAADYYNGSDSNAMVPGVQIYAVEDGGPGERRGTLQRGYHHPAERRGHSTAADLTAAENGLTPGCKTILIVYRAGEYREVPVVLGELPDEDGEEDHGWCDFDNAW